MNQRTTLNFAPKQCEAAPVRQSQLSNRMEELQKSCMESADLAEKLEHRLAIVLRCGMPKDEKPPKTTEPQVVELAQRLDTCLDLIHSANGTLSGIMDRLEL